MQCRPALILMRLWILLPALNAGCGVFPIPLPGVGNVPASFSLPDSDGQSSFLFHGGYIVADVTVNDEGPYKFLLDTGASVTVVSPKIADTLPQNVLGTTSIVSSVDSNSVDTRFLLIDHLQTGPVIFQRFQVAVLPSIAITTSSQTVVADGILGAPLFRNLILTVNYPGQVLRLRDGAISAPSGCAVLPTQNGPDDLPSLDLSVVGRDVRAVIDTGNNEFLLLPSSFSNLPFSGPTHTSMASTVTGQVTTIKGMLAGSVQSGCVSYTNPTVTVGGNIASMGSRAFADYTVTLDQTSGRFWFESAAQ